MRFGNQVALVTDAATGIGAATARRLVQVGAKLFAVNVIDTAARGAKTR